MKLEALSKRGGRTLGQVCRPWEGYDPTCEIGGFFPIPPEELLDPGKLKDLPGQLKKAESSLQSARGRNRFMLRKKVERLKSWIDQLDGMVPEKAGEEYRNWVETLRARSSVG